MNYPQKDWKDADTMEPEDLNADILVWRVETPTSSDDDCLMGVHYFRSYKEVLSHIKDIFSMDFITRSETEHEGMKINIQLVKMRLPEFIDFEGN